MNKKALFFGNPFSIVMRTLSTIISLKHADLLALMGNVVLGSVWFEKRVTVPIISEQEEEKTMNGSCKNCEYLYEKSGVLGHLECRRYPPRVFPQGGMVSLTLETKYPRVEEDYWCGEFKSRNKKQ